MRTCFLYCVLFYCTNIFSQSLGGNASFNFINQSNCSQLSALGNINISNFTKDVAFTYSNPSLLRKDMNKQLSVSFNNYLAGIKNFSATSAFYLSKIDVTLGTSIQYFNYGNITETDAIGNILGNSSAKDFVLNISVSKQYKDNWYIGTALKYAGSNYGIYKSTALAFDASLLFFDTTKQIQTSCVIKNLGTQLKTYTTGFKEELPFDVQLGFTKKLLKAPLQFSVTAHHLQRFDILYNDSTLKILEGDDNYTKKNLTDKIFTHLIFSAQFFLNDKIEISTGYNFLQRHDLNVYNVANGLNGFSFGCGLLLKKLQFRYAAGLMQKNSFHHISINTQL